VLEFDSALVCGEHREEEEQGVKSQWILLEEERAVRTAS
jgi:hypothetical protein